MSEVYASVDPSDKRNALAPVNRLVGLGNEGDHEALHQAPDQNGEFSGEFGG
jgi:hypothetical protein